MLVDSTSIPLRNLQSSPPASCHVLPWLPLLFPGGLPSRLVWIDTTGKGLNDHVYSGCLPLIPGGRVGQNLTLDAFPWLRK